jgi:hypothetical protein
MAIPIRGLSQFKSALRGGGARPNLFEVELPASIPIITNQYEPAARWSQDEQLISKFLCKAAALPGSISAPVEIPFRGRTFKVIGDRSFDTWTVTVINDENFAIRKAMEGWMQAMNQYSDHCGLTEPASYMRDAKVFQLGKKAPGTQCTPERGSSTNNVNLGGRGTANVLMEYRLIDIFPTNVAPIDLSYDSENTVEEFTVEFQINYAYPV